MLVQKNLKIAYVDVNFILNNSRQIKALKEENAKKNKELQIWLSKVNTSLMEQGSAEEQQKMANQYNLEFAQKQEEDLEELKNEVKEIKELKNEVRELKELLKERD